MKIDLQEIPIREIAKNYVDNAENGVQGYDGKLNIRPPYQREFVYNEKQRVEVINSIRQNFPLNVMYWIKNDGGTFEILDGQQRTISFCQYVNGDFSVNSLAFDNLTNDQREQILNYKTMVYFCEGTDSEKLKWFEIINIAGERLTQQELRNATYPGPWLFDAKAKFSKGNCGAYNLAKNYVSGSHIRQEYLEAALEWINDGDISGYMSAHQHDPNANELWLYFQNVIHWVESVFTEYRREMKGVNWGELYAKFSKEIFDTDKLEREIRDLMMDDDVTKRSGIFPYVLTRNEKYLNIRAFTDNMKRAAYERQGGKCAICGSTFDIAQTEADHITPWSEGGKSASGNCQILCKDCNRAKGNR